MAKNSNTSFAYEALVSIILPEGILNVFEVVNVKGVHTGFIEERYDFLSKIPIPLSWYFKSHNDGK